MKKLLPLGRRRAPQRRPMSHGPCSSTGRGFPPPRTGGETYEHERPALYPGRTWHQIGAVIGWGVTYKVRRVKGTWVDAGSVVW